MEEKGVKRIGHLSGKTMLVGDYGVQIVADEEQTFHVKLWDEGITEKDKQKILWEIIDPKTNEVLKEVLKNGDNIKLSITAKLAGKNYKLRASTLQQENKYGAYIFVEAYTDPLIIDSKWSLTENGDNIKNGKPIQYGKNVHLTLATEGLNDKEVIIDVLVDQAGEDKVIKTYTKVRSINGQIKLCIRDTYSWKGKLRFYTAAKEKFYVRIKYNDRYVPNKLKLIDHATNLVIENKIKSAESQVPTQNNLPVKIGENDIYIKRYEACGYTGIVIKEDGKDKNIILFDELKLKLENVREFNSYTYENIYYDYDRSFIRSDAKPILDNIAVFLNDNSFLPVTLGSHTDSRGTEEYNRKLSQSRAKSAVDYLKGKGVSGDRIFARGYGKSLLLIKDADISKDTTIAEKQHQANRRTTLEFQIYGNEAKSIEFNTIAPCENDKKKYPILIKDHIVDECFRNGDQKHKKEVPLTIIHPSGSQSQSSSVLPIAKNGEITPQIYSSHKKYWVGIPLVMYIWPEKCSPVHFQFRINTCRYYSDKSKTTLIVKAYPDIKWTLDFFFNLTTLLGSAYNTKGITETKYKDLQSKAGKMGAEKRWEQKDASFGISLKAEWNKPENNYLRSEELSAEFESKFKSLFNLFSSIGDVTNALTKKVRGGIRSTRGSLPMTFEIKPPNVSVSGVWALARVTKDKKPSNKIGTQVKVVFKADPLIGLELTIDLLGAAVGVAAGVLSGGTALEPAMRFYNVIKKLMNKGVEVGDDNVGVTANMDIYLDLILSNVITVDLAFNFNTKGSREQAGGALKGKSTLKAELKAGIYAKAEVALVVAKVIGYFEGKASGYASVSLGGSLYTNTDKGKEGVYLRPELGFDGLKAEYVVYLKIGVSSKKVKLKGNKTTLKASDEGVYTVAEDSIELIPPFDLVKELEKTFDFEANIKLM